VFIEVVPLCETGSHTVLSSFPAAAGYIDNSAQLSNFVQYSMIFVT
jgi:hypothetical protein